MNHAQTVIDIYRALHGAAPGSDAGQRFMRDVSSWAAFSLLARLCRTERPSPEGERDLMGLASIAGIYARAAGRDWLDEQVDTASVRLASPSVREQADDEARVWARDGLDDRDLRKAAELQAKGAATMARRNAAALPSAQKEFAAYMNACGCFNRGQPLMANLRPDSAQRFVDKVRKSLDGLPAAMYAFGEPTAARELREWLRTDALDKLLADAEPAFDDSWLAEHEIASEEAEEQANFERHEHELRSIAADVQSRTSYRAAAG